MGKGKPPAVVNKDEGLEKVDDLKCKSLGKSRQILKFSTLSHCSLIN